MDVNDIKAGDYELVAELFDQPLSKPEDKVFRFKRFRRGDVVTLDEEEAKRLVLAGAVVEPGSLERALIEQTRAAYEAALALLPPKPDEPAEPELVDEDGGDGDKPVADMLLAELRDYAKAKGYDLDGATKVEDIRTKVLAADAAAAQP